ncbi:FAD-dependent oxidoreductase [Tabrizicola sp.]|jgi:predicted NAD/FAD-binding protein|uniref:NAD(P)/FAD-dependent oxidoreductase n=1 Tax=Tabrizicola sp. TaxID=2005166 RepID=UPI000BC93327|nr:FAD-dependent oxidoreductase [Tabrizicola sp.]MBY0350535.1 FAD-dependent oxidoreductase [Tabrizicola sp.]MDK2774433.1 FAD-dependent oxidoreductase [Tabrizicola sp.]OYX20533.1 MAG: cyclopropane-fatty-acyl-phospholipid synthase [Rhodobacterales bacterium 32-66-9]
MPFEHLGQAPRRIAVVGGGISGMAAAHLLGERNRVVLYEAEPRLGGHSRTVIAGRRKDQPVDTGFIVFNRVNYPRLVRLFDRLGVPTAPSTMSFGASIRGGALEYGLASVDTIFAQRRNAFSPRFLQMLTDILHFNRNAEAMAGDPAMTIGELLGRLRTGRWFRDHYITPFSGAIWSTPTTGILDFPAQALVRFFRNHALMDYDGQHQWYTVKGGSIEYVRRLQAAMTAQGVDIRTGTPVASVRREAGSVFIRAVGAEPELFDDVVFATHSDISLRLLADGTPAETQALAAIRFQPNEAVLHADPTLMPRSRKVWSSWSYVEPKSGPGDRIDLTYWMNSLQPIPEDDPLFVTLNTTRPIRDHLIHDVTTFHHPVFDVAAFAAQDRLRLMNGSRNTWFCGAWMRNGFHEDGFASAVDVVQAMAERQSLRLVA